VLAVVDLEPRADVVVRSLSGGERSRISLASALLGRPELLVLDEPTVGLDLLLRRRLWNTFHRLAEEGATLLVSSHVMDEAERCDFLILLRDGLILAEAEPTRCDGGRPDRPRGGVPSPGGGAVSARVTFATALRVLRQVRRDRRTVVLIWSCRRSCSRCSSTCSNGSRRPSIGSAVHWSAFFVHRDVPDHVDHRATRADDRDARTLDDASPLESSISSPGYGIASRSSRRCRRRSPQRSRSACSGSTSKGRCGWSSCSLCATRCFGVALGLLASAFAQTEFQAVQFMPAFVLPQFLLCGLLVPRERMAEALEWVSYALPLSWAFEGLQEAVVGGSTTTIVRDAAIVLGTTVVALALGAATLRRRTP